MVKSYKSFIMSSKYLITVSEILKRIPFNSLDTGIVYEVFYAKDYLSNISDIDSYAIAFDYVIENVDKLNLDGITHHNKEYKKILLSRCNGNIKNFFSTRNLDDDVYFGCTLLLLCTYIILINLRKIFEILEINLAVGVTSMTIIITVALLFAINKLFFSYNYDRVNTNLYLCNELLYHNDSMSSDDKSRLAQLFSTVVKYKYDRDFFDSLVEIEKLYWRYNDIPKTKLQKIVDKLNHILKRGD